MRTVFISILCVAVGVAILYGIPVAWRVRRFMREHPVIATADDLEAFKRLAAREMYVAILGMPLPFLPGVTLVVALFQGALSVIDIWTIFLPLMVVMSISGLLLKRIEDRVRSLDVTDPTLRKDYVHVCETWVYKAFPDW